MKSICANCNLGLKRSECTDIEYTECECRRWIIELLKNNTIHGFMSVFTEVLEAAYENENDLKRNEAQIINILSRKLIE